MPDGPPADPRATLRPPGRDSSARRRCVRWPGLDLRPTKQRGQNFVIDANTVRRIVRAAGVDARRRGRRGRPRPRFADPRAAAEAAARASPSRSTRCWPARCPPRSRSTRPRYADRFDRRARPTRCGSPLPGPAPTALVANLPYNVAVPVLLHLLARLPSLRARARDGAGGGGRPARRRPGLEGVRRPVGEGRLVRRRAPGRLRRAQRLLAGAQRRLRPGRLDPPASRRRRRSTREQVFAVVDAAFAQRRKTLRGGAGRPGPGRPPPPRPRWSPPVSTRWRAGESLRRRGVRPASPTERRAGDRHDRCAAGARPAKINLHLGVGGLRVDGFHELHTVYHAISLHDDLTAAALRRLAVTRHAATTSAPPTPDDRPTLAVRAALPLAARHGVAADADVHLDASGSRSPAAWPAGRADAAAALVRLRRAVGAPGSPRAELLELAAELGSDVPFALLGGTAARHRPRRGGRAGAGPRHLVVGGRAVADDGLSTPAVYRRVRPAARPTRRPEPPRADALMAALRHGRPARPGADRCTTTCRRRRSTCAPALRELVARGRGRGALGGMVSGSGPTCVFLCESEAHAEAVAGGLRGAATARRR